MKKIIINGAKGKMGAEAVAAVIADPQLELVASLGRNDDLTAAIVENHADCVVDLTTPESVFANASCIIANNAHPIIGTTGLTDTQIQTLQQKCDEKQLGGLIAPNFSIAAVLMMQLSKQVAKFLPDVEIIELHHEQKKDAPSGTAIKTAKLIADARDAAAKTVIDCHESIAGALGGNCYDIPIHSVRLPGLVAHQQVLFGGYHETLSIRHDSLHRKSFMPGIVLACKEVPKLKALVYGLEHLLKF